ncbi:hypothetical protein ACXZ1K_11415 [Pedobacter sp. PWIIR3]
MKKEHVFWNWFKENEAKYFFLNQIEDDDEREEILNDFLEHLHLYCENLYFEIGGMPDEKQDLIVTAGGNEDFFEAVETLVEAAPSLENWNIIAFKPAIDDGVISYDGVKLDAETMYFMPLENSSSKKIGLRVYEPNYDPNHKSNFINCLHLVLDNLLGEKASVQEIGYLEMRTLTNEIDTEDLIKLVALPKYIKWKRSRS